MLIEDPLPQPDMVGQRHGRPSRLPGDAARGVRHEPLPFPCSCDNSTSVPDGHDIARGAWWAGGEYSGLTEANRPGGAGAVSTARTSGYCATVPRLRRLRLGLHLPRIQLVTVQTPPRTTAHPTPLRVIQRTRTDTGHHVTGPPEKHFEAPTCNGCHAQTGWSDWDKRAVQRACRPGHGGAGLSLPKDSNLRAVESSLRKARKMILTLARATRPLAQTFEPHALGSCGPRRTTRPGGSSLVAGLAGPERSGRATGRSSPRPPLRVDGRASHRLIEMKPSRKWIIRNMR